jgi:hypothetical protein
MYYLMKLLHITVQKVIQKEESNLICNWENVQNQTIFSQIWNLSFQSIKIKKTIFVSRWKYSELIELNMWFCLSETVSLHFLVLRRFLVGTAWETWPAVIFFDLIETETIQKLVLCSHFNIFYNFLKILLIKLFI